MFSFFTACTRASRFDKDSGTQEDYKFGQHYGYHSGLTIKKGMLARLTDLLTLSLQSLLVRTPFTHHEY